MPLHPDDPSGEKDDRVLRYLHIRNIAVIEDLEVEFGPGLNVISGETGSGKSILVDAVGLLAGARGAADLIRSGESRAMVEGVFELPADSAVWQWLGEEGLDREEADGGLVVRRELTAGGGGRAQVGGRLVSMAFLRRLGDELLEIHGQHDCRLLLQPRYHLRLLDNYHGQRETLQAVADLAREIESARAELDRLVRDEQSRLQRLDLLDFQISDIDSANPAAGEEERLNDERRILANAEKLFQLSTATHDILYESGESVLQQLERLLARHQEMAAIDPRLARTAETLQAVVFQLEDAAFTARDHAATIEYNENRLNEIESRLMLLDRIKRKYGPSLEDVLDYFQAIQGEREQLRHSDERMAELQRTLDALQARYRRAAESLSQARRKAAKSVEKEMKKHLDELDMKGTRFQVRIQPVAAAEASPAGGLDDVEFIASPNVGEELRPLPKIASGGELSRLALAIKLILRSEPDAVLIFDEIDAGIGGGTAEVVGRKLGRVAATNQSFCVTHSPLIAAQADHHFQVAKSVAGGRTFTMIQRLDPAQQIEELARMLGGVQITDITRQHARQLLGRD
jgi:DNA repair protein RecN (Recombination protein N)